MANRIILLVSVLLAAVALTATSTSAAPTADECLAAPKGQAPAGKHWNYRTNRATKRKCWYLSDEGATDAAVTPSKRSASAPPVDPGQPRGVQAPTANARAELIDEPRRQQPSTPAIQPQPDTFQLVPDDANMRNSAVASRWPDPSNAFSVAPATMANDPAPALQTENPSPVLAAGPVETAEQPSAAADSPDNVSFAQFATALVLVFVIIVGGASLMSFVLRRLHQRNSSHPHRVTPHVLMPHVLTPHVMRRDEMLPWARFGEASATRPAAMPRAPERSRLGDEIEEMEQLLAVAREARAS